MKLPTIKKILREDLKEAPSWVNGLIDPLNSFMETVYQALNKNITLSENVASFVTEFTYTTPSGYPIGQGTFSISNTLKTRPIGVLPLQVYDKITYVPAPGPVYIPWAYQNGNLIEISTITGLEASKTYTVRVVVF